LCVIFSVTTHRVGAAADSPASIWIDSENTVTNNFRRGHVLAEMRADAVGAAGGQYMAVQVGKTAGDAPYFAEYQVEVKRSGNYKLWLAGSPQNAGWASPLYLRIDDMPFISLAGRPTLSKVYGLKPLIYFGWVNAGTYDLSKGAHRLRLEVRDVRAADQDYVAFFDSLWLTQDLDAIPEGIAPEGSGQVPWERQVKEKGFDPLVSTIRAEYYKKRLSAAREFDGGSLAEIEAKLLARPLPGSSITDPGPFEFGVHGMEVPFVRAGVNEAKIQHAYELLARVGVQSFRTAESCWHRLGQNYDNFKELDYQVDSSARYGMTQLLTVGYPPAPYRVSKSSGLSAVKPEYYGKYRDYLERVLKRYAGRGVIRYVELGNEVDAPNPWWRDSTPQMYVDEMKIVHEVTKKVEPTASTVAFGATYSRNETRGGPDGGRRFIRQCFDLGIADYADAYSIHYTWPLAQKDFAAFIRREEAARGLPEKPILNTEEAGYGHPSDILKLFARDFYLYGMPRVDYYLARDWYEAGTLIYSGLFDLNWNPKPRLLAYAAAVDAMRGRVLVGMLKDDDNREVYVLETKEKEDRKRPRYAIVAWVNSKQILEFHAPGIRQSLPALRRELTGLQGAEAAQHWNLDPIPVPHSGVIEIGQYPVVIFTDQKPGWELIAPDKWLEIQAYQDSSVEALVPVK
jgi:hypothetical protein